MDKKNVMFKKKKRNTPMVNFKNQIYLQLMVFPGLIGLILFRYLPIYGLQIAFKDFKFNQGIWGSEWIGIKHFQDFINDPYIVSALVNTIGISFLTIAISFPIAILFAIGINEITNSMFRRVAQTVAYLPHFISWVILSVMLNKWLSPTNGFVNDFLVATGILKEPYYFLGSANAFWPLASIITAWKETGWSSIIFLAAIAGINIEFYESASLDGASIIQKARYITIPSILPTVMIVLILRIGSLIRGNFDISFLLGNTINIERSQIIDTYVYKIGMQLGRYSYASAVGLFSGLASMILVIGANQLSKVLTRESLF